MMVRGRVFHYFAALEHGVGELGMPLHPATGEVLSTLDDFDWHAYKRANQIPNIAAIRASFTAAVDFARAWRPDLVVHDLLSAEGVLAGRVAGVPSACHLWGPIGTDEHEPGVNLIQPDHTGTFVEYGQPQLTADLIEHVIDPCPPGVVAPTRAARHAVRFVPYNGPGAPPALPPPTRPRVGVVWGNSLSQLLGPVSFIVPKILRALADQDVEVVVTTTAGAADGIDTPANARLLENCPLRLLLPDCSAVVHHGGAGSGMTAVAHGVPQLALPFTPEQAANAERLVATGVGIARRGPAVTERQITEDVRALLDQPEYGAAARALRAEQAGQPAPSDLVRDLELLAGVA
jgi:UDP:flavonoid glycosyltransferase YjiC (YdhE family)